MDISPGPGWTKGKYDEGFYPHLLTYSHFPGARAVAGVFKMLAAILIAIGVLAAIEAATTLHDHGASNGNVVAVVAGIIGGTIITASAMAFFGYVLQLLVAIHFDVRFEQSSKLAEHLNPEP